MAVSRLIAEIEVKNGELAIKQVRGFNDAVEESGKAGSRASKGLAEQEKHTSKLSKASENWLGVSAKVVAAGVAIDFAYKGVKAAASYQQLTTRLETQAGLEAKETNKIRGEGLKIATETAQSQNVVAESYYHVASAGYRGAKAHEAVTDAMKMSTISGAGAIETTNTLTAVMKSGIKGSGDLGKSMGVLDSIVGHGDMTFEELNESLGSGLAVQAKLAGVSLVQLGGALDVLHDNNIRGAKSATYLRQMLETLAAPTAKQKNMLAGMGIGPTQMREVLSKGGPLAATKYMKQVFTEHHLSEKEAFTWMSEFFGKKAGAGFKVLYNQTGAEQKKEGEVGGAGNQTAQQWKKTTKNFTFVLKQLKTMFGVLEVKLGNALIPVLDKLAAKFETVLEWTKKNWSWFKVLVFTVLAVAAGFKILNKAQDIYKDGQKAAAVVTKVFRAVLMQQTEASRLAQVNEDLRAASTDAATGATEGATVASYEFDAANILWIGALVLGIAVIALVVTHFKLFKRIGLDAFHWVEQAAKNVWSWIKSNWPYLLAALGGPFALAAVWAIKHWHEVLGFIKSVPHKIESAFSSVARMIAKPFEDAWRKIPAPLRGIIGGAAHLVGGGIHAVTSLLPHFAAGGVVPGYGMGDTIPAMLTPGEFVLNRQAVSTLGVGTLNALNGGGWRGGGEAQEYVPIVVINKMDSRVLSESTTRYALKKRRGA